MDQNVLNGELEEPNVEARLVRDPMICDVCLIERINCATLCGHKFCRRCIEMVIATERRTYTRGEPRCPQCRQPIGRLLPVYF